MDDNMIVSASFSPTILVHDIRYDSSKVITNDSMCDNIDLIFIFPKRHYLDTVRI